MINKVILIGRFVKDIAIYNSKNNMAVGYFTLAINSYVSKTNSNKTDYINCVAFSNLANNISKFTKKGSLAYVEGTLSNSSYTDKNNQVRYKTDVIVSIIKFLSGPSNQNNSNMNDNFNLSNNNIKTNDFKKNDFKTNNTSTNTKKETSGNKKSKANEDNDEIIFADDINWGDEKK